MVVGEAGFEPTASSSQSLRATRLRHSPSAAVLEDDGADVNGAPSEVLQGPHICCIAVRVSLEYSFVMRAPLRRHLTSLILPGLLLVGCGANANDPVLLGADVVGGQSDSADGADASGDTVEPSDRGPPGVDVARPPPEPPGPSEKNASLFAPAAIVDFHITVTDAEWQTLQTYREAQKKEYVHADFEYDGEAFNNAGLRFKSNPEDWAGNKPQFVIKFNEFVDKGRFRGLRRVVLEANPSDATLCRNNLALSLMRQAGVITPRSNHARLYLNGTYFGLYEHIEAIDEEFLEDRFGNPGGNLYENSEQLKTNEATASPQDLEDYLELVESPPSAERRAQMAEKLDMDAFILLAAAEAVLPVGDNFWAGGWNYELYAEPGAGFTILPWDLDDVFGKPAPADADLLTFGGLPQYGNTPNPVWLAIKADEVWKAQFLSEVSRIARDIHSHIGEEATACFALVRGDVEADPNRKFAVEDIATDTAAVSEHIVARAASLKAQLAALVP